MSKGERIYNNKFPKADALRKGRPGVKGQNKQTNKKKLV